jgi:cytochrome c oxidase subunit 2
MIVILLVIGLVFLAGCSSPPPANNKTISCNEYCVSQPHVQCVGEWKISGTYPNCVCNFECRSEPPPNNSKPNTNITPPSTIPPPANNTTQHPSSPPDQSNITPQSPLPPPPSSIRTIEITARKWDFSPGTISVKKGETVKLMITSEDVTHGFSLPEFGIDETLKPGEIVEVEFTPDKTGSFTFRCSVFCGTGHGGMKGTLIVED